MIDLVLSIIGLDSKGTAIKFRDTPTVETLTSSLSSEPPRQK